MSFCTNCGSKLDDDARFCPVCGMKQDAVGVSMNMGYEPGSIPQQKNLNKKKIAGIAVGAVAALAIIGGGVTTIVRKNKANKPQAIMEAFSEYYDAFCEDHYMDDVAQYNMDYSVARYFDCIGRVLYIDDEPVLMISDMVGLTGDPNDEDSYTDAIYDVYFYTYDGKEVKEKNKIRNILACDDGFKIFVEDDTFLLVTEARAYYDISRRGEAVYEMKGNNVSAYLCKESYENEDTSYDQYCELDGRQKEVSDVSYLVVKAFDRELDDTDANYVFGDWIDDPTYGALVGNDFTDYLKELGKLDEIKSERQLENKFFDYMGYEEETEENRDAEFGY